MRDCDLDIIRKEISRPDGMFLIDPFHQFIIIRKSKKEKAIRRAKWRAIKARRRT